MVARVHSGSSALTCVRLCALRAVSRAASATFVTCTVSLGGRNERVGRLVHAEAGCSGPPVTVGRGEGELCVLSCLSTRRNACAWGLPGILSCHADGFHDTTFST